MTKTKSNDLRDFEAGDKLRNGATLVSYAVNGHTRDGVVLAYWPKGETREWIVWSVFRHEANSTCWGHYFRDRESAEGKFAEKRAQYRTETVL